MLARCVAIIFVAALSPLFSDEPWELSPKGNVNVGGGPVFPLRPTSRYANPSAFFEIGGGYDFTKHHSFVGEFMWVRLFPNRASLPPVVNPLIATDSNIKATSALYSVTANYMYRQEWRRFGVYGIGGGGWYYRHAKVSQEVVQGTPCVNLLYWGYTCSGGYTVSDETLASTGSSAFGGNVGFGFTIRLADSGEKFYVESRYHYAPTRGVAMHIIPVTFGLRW